jgi:SAM-dependent methyltransferase
LPTKEDLKLKLAIKQMRESFPFRGYTDPQLHAYLNISHTVLHYLHPGSKILDFGCGPCDKTAVLQILGYNCSGVDELQDDWHLLGDNKEKIISYAKAQGIGLSVSTGGKLPFEKESFDMVMMHDVLEHLHDSPRELLNELLELIKPGGYFFTTVPSAVNIRKRLNVMAGRTNLPRFDGYYWYPGRWRGHIREYTKGDLRKLAKYLDLEILELRSCHHMLNKIPIILKPVYVGLTNIFSGWRDSWLLVARKKNDWIPQRKLSNKALEIILQQGTTYHYSH